jgi:hypothetical protein
MRPFGMMMGARMDNAARNNLVGQATDIAP